MYLRHKEILPTYIARVIQAAKELNGTEYAQNLIQRYAK